MKVIVNNEIVGIIEKEGESITVTLYVFPLIKKG